MAFGRNRAELLRLERDLYQGLSDAGHIEIVELDFIDFGRGAQLAYRIDGRPARGGVRFVRLTPPAGNVARLGWSYGKRMAASYLKTRERKRIAKQRRRSR